MRTSIIRVWKGIVACTALVATLSFTGCKKTADTDKGSLVLSQTELSMPADGATKPISLQTTSTANATVEAAAKTWLSCTVSGKLMKVTATKNDGSVRTGVITVINEENITATLKVTQLGFDASLTMDADYSANPVQVEAAGKEFSLNVYSNVEFKVTKDNAEADWYTVTTGDQKVTVNVVATPLFSAREASFTITPTNTDYAKLAKTVKISQAALVHAITASCAGLADGKVTVPANDAELEVSIVTNDAWTASVSEGGSWISVDPAQGGTVNENPVLVVCQNNTGASDRTATVSFKSGDATATIEVTQRGAGVFMDFSTDPVTIQSEAGTYKIAMSTNATNISVTSTETWVSANASIEKDTLIITYEENKGDGRSATLTVKGQITGYPDIVKNIEIHQNRFATNLAVNAEGTEETANCYVVSKAGTYKFPAKVKGNGSVFYDAEGFEDKTVTPVLTLDGAASATQIWSTKQTGLLSDVKYSGGYIYFSFDTFEVGNAGIALKDADGRILWSWHIWATPFDTNDPAHQYKIGEMTDADGNTYYSGYAIPCTFMGLNLGATNDGNHGDCTPEELKQATGFLYQWGRKDPFVGGTPDYTIAYTAPVGGANAVIYFHDTTMDLPEEITRAESTAASLYVTTPQETVDGTIQWAIEHPTVFIKSIGTYDGCVWLSSGKTEWNGHIDVDKTGSMYWGHLWGNMSTDNASTGKKSIYDPCPPGWQVPCPGNWGLITAHGDEIGAYYGSYAAWKYNCQEALDAIDQGTLNPLASVTNESGVKSWDQANMVKFPTFKGGFNVFVTSSNTGKLGTTIYKDTAIDESERVEEDVDMKGTGPMFLPSAGWRMGYNGNCYRSGAAATYFSNEPIQTDVTNNGGLNYWGVKGMSMWVDGVFYRFSIPRWGEWQAAGRSIRCVKQNPVE